MKLLFALFFALVVTASAFAQGSKNYVDATGALKSSLAVFSNVINSAAAPLTKGMAVCLDLTDDNGVSVDYCAGEGFKPLGVIVDASCAVGARCKMQTKGIFAFGKFDYLATATIAGGMVYADVDGDIVRPATVLVSHFPLGVSLDAISADTSTLDIYIDL